MEKIRILKRQDKPSRSERVVCWVTKDVSDALTRIAEETGASKQYVTDMLLRKAIDAVEIVDDEILM